MERRERKRERERERERDSFKSKIGISVLERRNDAASSRNGARRRLITLKIHPSANTWRDNRELPGARVALHN